MVQYFCLAGAVRNESNTLPEWTFDRKRIKRISATNPNLNSNPNPKAQKRFREDRNDVIFRASVQIYRAHLHNESLFSNFESKCFILT